jgi:arsenate reductase
MKNILFLCTGNSCRSIMAEALLNHIAPVRFTAYSAGSFPIGSVHPLSLETLKARGISTTGYSSKSWDNFANYPIDIVITVCDAASGESCPIFPETPLKAHWGVPDPAKFQGTESEIRSEFSRVCDILERRINILAGLPVGAMDKGELQQKLYAIGKTK